MYIRQDTTKMHREYVGNWYIDVTGEKVVDVYCRHNKHIAKLKARQVASRDDLVMWSIRHGKYAWENICSKHTTY